jgi:hypothetical protein
MAEANIVRLTRNSASDIFNYGSWGSASFHPRIYADTRFADYLSDWCPLTVAVEEVQNASNSTRTTI